MNTFTKHLQLNFKTLMLAKFFKFLKKSVWMYLICSIVIALVYPALFGSTFKTGLYLFQILILVSQTAMLFGSWFLYRKLDFDADVTFSEENSIIACRNKDRKIEERDWSWIKKISVKKNSIWLEIDQQPPFIINLYKTTLHEDEVLFFKRKTNKNG